MLGKYKYHFQLWLINLGIKLLPKNFQEETFIINCMKTNIIKVKKQKPKTEEEKAFKSECLNIANEANNFAKSIDLSKTNWQPIETVPKDKVVVLGIDSYDCGWIFASAWWHKDEKCWISAGPSELTKLQSMPYTHWFIPDKLCSHSD